MKSQRGWAMLGLFFFLLFACTCAVGYVSNLINVIESSAPTAGLFWAEIIGLVVAPLGVVLGWIFF